MTTTYHNDITQGSPEWHSLRCGILTASEMKLILTPTLKIASNDKERSHLFELLAQRITQYVEPSYISDNMIRGKEDEIAARDLYAATYEPVEEVGFVTNDDIGFTIGYSPDGLVGHDGLIECKSRCQKYQIETIVTGEVPSEYVLQLQTGLLVTGREWIDFISYCAGMPMFTKRVYRDQTIIDAIVSAAEAFEVRLQDKLALFNAIWNDPDARLIPTERVCNLLEE